MCAKCGTPGPVSFSAGCHRKQLNRFVCVSASCLFLDIALVIFCVRAYLPNNDDDVWDFGLMIKHSFKSKTKTFISVTRYLLTYVVTYLLTEHKVLKTRLSSNLRPTRCAFSYAWSIPVTRQRWRSQHLICHSQKIPRYTQASWLCFIEPELLSMNVIHCGNRGFRPFCSYDLFLDPMTFIYELDRPYCLEILDVQIWTSYVKAFERKWTKNNSIFNWKVLLFKFSK